jgi:hypothetical protein
VLCYLIARDRGGVRWWVISGLLIGLAYLAKEPALFIGGAMLLHMVWERRAQAALLFAAGVFTVGAVEHAYYYAAHGSIFFRSQSTQLWNLKEPSNIANLARDLDYLILRKYPRLMIVPDLRFGLHSIACLIGAAAALWLKPRRWYGLVILWAVIPWIYLNFGSWSFEQYAPLPRDPRYLEFTYPPLMLLTGVVVSRALAASPAVARPVALALALVLASGVAIGIVTRGRTARAPEMAVLREIVRAVHRTPEHKVFTNDPRWRVAVDIFAPSTLSSSPETATFILERDALDLPVAVRQALPVRTEQGPESP